MALFKTVSLDAFAAASNGPDSLRIPGKSPKNFEAVVKNFEDLSKDQWAGRICVRSSNNIYNQSLVASLIANHGEKKAEVFVKKLVKNFARKP